MNNFGKNLAAIRAAKGLTQQDLATQIKVTNVTVGNWERGVSLPQQKYLVALSEALSVPVSQLVGGDYKNFWLDIEIDRAERDFLSKLRKLDRYGVSLVRLVLDKEFERVDEQNKKRSKTSFASQNRYIPLYSSVAAAGYGVPLEGEEFEMLKADELTPPNADFAVKISGDSMSPYINDGDIVFVRRTETVKNGEIAVFCVDGEMFCKQYLRDEQGNVLLFSLNRALSGADIFINRESEHSVKCCGVVVKN